MKTYKIPCVWTMAGTVEVQADSEEKAIEKAINEAPLPTNGEYVSDSFAVDEGFEIEVKG